MLIATLVAHACGYAFGVSNQTTYFLSALQRAHPELLHRDWLVSSTTPYHTVFSALAAYGFRADDGGTVAFGIAHVAIMVAVVCGVFLVVGGATRRSALPVLVLVVGWLAVNGERSIAGSYLWSSYLQPSLLGAAGWMIALGLFVRGRSLGAGIALAIGGVFHVNFLIVGIATFALAQLAVDRRLKPLLLLLAPQLVAALVVAPEIFANLGARDPEHALWVLVQFHAPGHYKPSRILRALPYFVRWIALAAVIAPVVLRSAARDALHRLLVWSLIAAGLCVAVALMTLIPPCLPLTRLYVSRLAPFALVAAQIVIAIAMASDRSAWRELPAWRRAIAAALAIWICVQAPFWIPAEAAWVSWLALATVAITALVPAPRWLLAVTAVATLAAPLVYRRHVILRDVETRPDDHDALYAWARTSPVDAVFLTPPDLLSFRLLGRRAIYVDFKSPPLAPDGLVAWHERLCRVTGAAPTQKVPDHRERWLAASGEELLSRARSLGVDYLVLDRSAEHDRIAAPPVYRNDHFAVFIAR